MKKSQLRSAVAEPTGGLALRVAERLHRRVFVPLEYPASADSRPRWGHGRPSHPGLERVISSHDGRYRESLELIGRYREEFARIPLKRSVPGEPAWINGFQPGLDCGAIYAFMRAREPAMYLEVGSGTSTSFAARARRDGSLATRIISIDPAPRSEIDALCDEIVRAPLETAELSAFDRLASGDIVFFDGSHRVFMNSDVTVFFLDILPRLPPGVLVGVHDIELPDDYRPDLAPLHYSEQYMLAAMLLAGADWIHPELASMYVSRREKFASAVDALWAAPELRGVERHGGAFWFSTSPLASD